MTRNGLGIIQPDAINVETTFSSGPLAQPVAVTVPGRDGIKMLAVGGLSKVEALAGSIAAGLLVPGVLSGGPPKLSKRHDPSNAQCPANERPGVPGLVCTCPRSEGLGGCLQHSMPTDDEYEDRIAMHALNIAEKIVAEYARRTKASQEVQAPS